MRANALFQAGKLDEAIDALGGELRDNPTDAQRRTFLFELLCFAGKYDRAEKQLEVLAQGGPQAQLGALLYRSALHAERTRQTMFERQEFPTTVGGSASVSATLNGRTVHALRDADPRVGDRFELFAAGQYMWIPFDQISSVRISAPTRLRDLLWTPAIVRTGAGFKGLELGEVLVPVTTPLAWQDDDPAVRLGRMTTWYELDDGTQIPVGQKLLLADDEECSILELRELDIAAVPAAAS